AVERLTDLALLDAQQPDLYSPPRYTLHPLARAFASSRLALQPAFESSARDRWVGWYTALVAQVGYCWDDLDRLRLLDPEQETVHSVVQWTLQSGRYADTLALARGAGYYYYVRGLWDKKPRINLMRAQAAASLGDTVDEVESLAYHVHMLSRQGEIAEAESYLAKLTSLAASQELPAAVFFEYQYATALYWMARRNFDTAQQAWEKSLARAEPLPAHRHTINLQWLAKCLYQNGQPGQARRLFREALDEAMQLGFQRTVIASKLGLAAIDLDAGNLQGAVASLAESSALAYQYQDRDNLAQIERLFARLHAQLGDRAAASRALHEAIDLFQRLGMRAELAEARAELARLDTPPVPEPDRAPVAASG
ncbi:MAG TPA: hypothetical protein VKY74_17235, partial [Chloroflexia bacterium]|nr:hypothetical protein [Chloroflexia bacterium]